MTLPQPHHSRRGRVLTLPQHNSDRAVSNNDEMERICHPEQANARRGIYALLRLLSRHPVRRSLDSFHSLGMTDLVVRCVNSNAQISVR